MKTPGARFLGTFFNSVPTSFASKFCIQVFAYAILYIVFLLPFPQMSINCKINNKTSITRHHTEMTGKFKWTIRTFLLTRNDLSICLCLENCLRSKSLCIIHEWGHFGYAWGKLRTCCLRSTNYKGLMVLHHEWFCIMKCLFSEGRLCRNSKFYVKNLSFFTK